MEPLSANQLRAAWLAFFEERGHVVVPSAGLVPHHPTAPMFTNAGMIPFVPYFLGEEVAPHATATSVQKCVRTIDIDIVGRTTRHLSFFEMLGNFSFGDYFKERAIALAWEFATEVMGFDGDRIWATVYLDDDDAEQIWRDTVGLPAERVQRLGDEDNFWEMQKGGTGPCGPNSELYFDRGPDHGEAGGPAHGSEERYLEFWNLVFMQSERQPDGSLVDLPARNVDTGAGFERNLLLLQGVDTVFETDVLAPLIEEAQRLTDTRYGADPTHDISLRLLADHARTTSFLVSDGVVPSNDDRGYVLRRVVRRAVRHAFALDVHDLVMPALAEATVAGMGEAYPDLVRNKDAIVEVLAREEEGFRRTLSTGLDILDAEFEALDGPAPLAGSVAFRLHDTHGFPVELTQEIAAERGLEVDVAGFEAAMAEQRARAKAAQRRDGRDGNVADFQAVVDAHGPTEFVGREEPEAKVTVLAVIDDSVVLDRTPFYAESGGQVGDTGIIRTDTGEARVVDTVYGAPGLHRHIVEMVVGEITASQEAVAAIDTARRDAIRRNHTATHLLHWALREVLGPHVSQQGSMVGPDRLRFDFSHFEALTPEQITAIEDLVNAETLANHPVRHFETTKSHAESLGAIAFFGDKYGDVVRVLEAGPHSTELCGGTHVRALGDIGPVKIVSETSIGSNIRRLEAITGFGPLERLRQQETALADAAAALGVSVDEVVEGAARRTAEIKRLTRELETLRREAARADAGRLAEQAQDGVVTARLDGLDRNDYREMAVALRERPDIRAVVLGGEPDGGGAALVAAVDPAAGLDAGELLEGANQLIGGGGRPNAEITALGGRDPEGVDAALAGVRRRLGLASP
jgi:alanyl-tRNA synthetase